MRYGDHELAIHAEGETTLHRLQHPEHHKAPPASSASAASAAPAREKSARRFAVAPAGGWSSASLACVCYDALGLEPPAEAVALLPAVAPAAPAAPTPPRSSPGAPRAAETAKRYLERHQPAVEEAISLALAAMVTERAEDPLSFLAAQFAQRAGLQG